MSEETSMITLNKKTIERLKRQGHKGQTYDKIVNELIDERESKKK